MIIRGLSHLYRHPRSHAASVLASIVIAMLASSMPARAQIDYPDMRSIVGLQLVGTAIQSDSVVDLHGFEPKLAGGMWAIEKQHVARGFTTSFRFQVRDTSGQDDAAGAKGGDGFAFVIQNAAPAPLGGAGGQLGYDPIRNSIAIEFDTYHNDEPGFNDPNGNHIAVHTTGTSNNSASHTYSIASTTFVPNLSDGKVHTVTIVYLNSALYVYLDGCPGLMIAMSLDIGRRLNLDNGHAWVGFTGATGSAWERHVIHSWRFNARPAVIAKRLSLCAGTRVRLSPPGRFHRYDWSTGATTPSIEVSTPGRYSVEVVDTLSCTPSYATFIYDVVSSAPPRPKISQSDTVVLCTGSIVTLDAGSFSAWRWSTGDTTRTIAARTPGVYAVTVTDSLGCTGVDSILVVASARPPVPRVTITGPTRFCSGDSVVLDAGGGYATYRWNNGATTQRIVVRDAGSYSVVVTNALGCSSSSQPTVVTVLARPYPVIQPQGPARFCRGGSVTLDAGIGYASYLWSNGATTPSITVDSSAVLTVTVSGANGCVGTSFPFTVIVDAVLTPEIIADLSTGLCRLDTVVLRTRTSYRSYVWSNGSTADSIAVTSSGTYAVDVVDSNGCRARAEYELTLDSNGAFQVRATGPTEMCEGASVTLHAPEGLADYRWSTGETTRSIVVERSGVYSVRATDDAGCAATDSIVITVHAQPTVHAVADTTICAGESVELIAAGGEFITWTPSDGLSCTECASTIATPSRTTRYEVIASNTGGCADTTWVVVTVLPAPTITAQVAGNPVVFPGSTVELPVVVSGQTSDIDELVVELAYGTSIAILRAIVLGNDMLNGWEMETLVDSAGLFRARFHSTDGRTLQDGQTLLTMRMQTFIGVPMRSVVTARLFTADMPCATIGAVDGTITIDSLCGLSGRLIESFDPTFALRPASPNPFNPSTRIVLSLGSARNVTIEVLDAAGARVELIHDGHVEAGDHEFDWNASARPSGLYVVRAVSASRSDAQVLLLVK